MIRALYSAGSGMSAQQMNVDNIAHNLANANTTGFKMRRTEFQDLLYQTVVQPGAAQGPRVLCRPGYSLASDHDRPRTRLSFSREISSRRTIRSIL